MHTFIINHPNDGLKTFCDELRSPKGMQTNSTTVQELMQIIDDVFGSITKETLVPSLLPAQVWSLMAHLH